MILDKKENDYFSFFFLQPDICQNVYIMREGEKHA